MAASKSADMPIDSVSSSNPNVASRARNAASRANHFAAPPVLGGIVMSPRSFKRGSSRMARASASTSASTAPLFCCSSP
jgi:hypothetical protein